MTDQSLVPTERSSPTTKLNSKTRQLVEIMVWEGLPYNEAALQVGLTVRIARQLLARSHVTRYMRQQRQMLREGALPRNITRLIEIRDAADNMPAVQAIKLLEEMDQVERSSPGGVGQSLVPGVTINIVSELPRVSIHADEGLPVSNPPMIALEPVKPR